jgi:hypothetical protein
MRKNSECETVRITRIGVKHDGRQVTVVGNFVIQIGSCRVQCCESHSLELTNKITHHTQTETQHTKLHKQ